MYSSDVLPLNLEGKNIVSMFYLMLCLQGLYMYMITMWGCQNNSLQENQRKQMSM